jgi:hypothetical protein
VLLGPVFRTICQFRENFLFDPVCGRSQTCWDGQVDTKIIPIRSADVERCRLNRDLFRAGGGWGASRLSYRKSYPGPYELMSSAFVLFFFNH